MFRIELLPAGHGDAIWIEYGNRQRPRRIVIDGGPASTYETGLRKRLLQLPANDRTIDLFVITHIDADHIDGAIILLREAEVLGVKFGEVWFNAWNQLPTQESESLKPIQGEFLGALLAKANIQDKWNAREKGKAIVISDDGQLATVKLPDGAVITLLSPGVKQLKRLRARWAAAIRDFSPGDSEEALRRLETRREYLPPAPPPVFAARTVGDDRSVANGSSIAFVIEHNRKACLLASDAHPRVLAAGLQRFSQIKNPGRGGVVHFDAVKMPHHGSCANINDELLAAMESRIWLISTNGAIYNHPDPETAELVAARSPEPPRFLCNYKCPTTIAFADRQRNRRWQTCYPGEGVEAGPTGGIVLDLDPAKQKQEKPRSKKPGSSKRRSKK